MVGNSFCVFEEVESRIELLEQRRNNSSEFFVLGNDVSEKSRRKTTLASLSSLCTLNGERGHSVHMVNGTSTLDLRIDRRCEQSLDGRDIHQLAHSACGSRA
jgi:hypothetical protein